MDNGLIIKKLGLAYGLHIKRQWERRAEDPFRGLRAGPVRLSPFTFADWRPGFASGPPPTYLNTPETPEHGESVAGRPLREYGIPRPQRIQNGAERSSER